jgi:hypothetical protein
LGTGGRESKRAVGLGTYVATVIALLAVVGIGAYMYLNVSSDLSELRQEHQAQSLVLQELNDSYADLSYRFSQLNQSYVSLQEENRNLSDIVGLKKTEAVLINNAIYLPANGFDGIEIASNYAGYLQVSISATSPISMLITNYKYGIILDYPVNGNTFISASFKMPILDGTTYLQFFVTPSSSSMVTINATVHY